MIHKPEHVMHWHVVVWTSLFVLGFMISTGILLGPKRRSLYPPTTIDSSASATTSTPATTGVATSSTTEATVASVPVQTTTTVADRAGQWSTIKSLLEQDDPLQLNSGVLSFTDFLKTYQPLLPTLLKTDYDDYYKGFNTAVSKVTSKAGSDLGKMKNLYYLTKWVYQHFPYIEGWFGGNKNEIADSHKGTCTNLQKLFTSDAEKKLYAFLELTDAERIQYVGQPIGDTTRYTWPQVPVFKTALANKDDYTLLENYVLAIESILYKIRPTNNPDAYIEALKAVTSAITIVTATPVSSRYRTKAVSRLWDTIQSSFTFSTNQTSLADTLTDSRSKLPSSSFSEAIKWLETAAAKNIFNANDITTLTKKLQAAQLKKFPK